MFCLFLISLKLCSKGFPQHSSQPVLLRKPTPLFHSFNFTCQRKPGSIVWCISQSLRSQMQIPDDLSKKSKATIKSMYWFVHVEPQVPLLGLGHGLSGLLLFCVILLCPHFTMYWPQADAPPLDNRAKTQSNEQASHLMTVSRVRNCSSSHQNDFKLHFEKPCLHRALFSEFRSCLHLTGVYSLFGLFFAQKDNSVNQSMMFLFGTDSSNCPFKICFLFFSIWTKGPFLRTINHLT